MHFFLLFPFIISLLNCADNYAVLVSGSKGYVNYRHQSNIFHTYQTLISKGMNPDNIIVMAYNDIANNTNNPFKGQIFNKPNGANVYENIRIDYSGADVTPTNFVHVLYGDAKSLKGIGTGRALQSTQEDNVFLFFDDHGADGVLAFPNELLFEEELSEILRLINHYKKYKHLIFYVEACSSGSLFEDMSLQDNIYVVTSAMAGESSYG